MRASQGSPAVGNKFAALFIWFVLEVLRSFFGKEIALDHLGREGVYWRVVFVAIFFLAREQGHALPFLLPISTGLFRPRAAEGWLCSPVHAGSF